MRLAPRRLRQAALVTAASFAALALPASASALQFHVVNESGRPASEVFVDIASPPETPKEQQEVIEGKKKLNYVVPGVENNVAVPLSAIPGGNVTIERLISGRVYVSYGAPVTESVTFSSPIRFDWAELTVNPAPEDAANLTAVNQVGIGMRLTTLTEGGDVIESRGSTYANTLFDALQGIPGGPESTIRGTNGEILRVLSPDNVPSQYPLLTDYVESMVGETIELHTPFFKKEEDMWSRYTGTFQPGGSITLTGEMWDEAGTKSTAPEIKIGGPELLQDIYTGGSGPNDLVTAVRRDLYSAFSVGLWGGKYGNDAIHFCNNPTSDPSMPQKGEWCPNGFNVPAFAEARTTPPPFTAFEQYAEVINRYTDIYGNPYSDASKKVQVLLDQPTVHTLQLTILPDSEPQPSTPSGPSGSSGSGSSTAKPAPPTSSGPLSMATLKTPKVAKVKKGKIAVGKVDCQGACGQIEATIHLAHGKARILATGFLKNVRKSSAPLMLKPKKLCLRLLKKKGSLQGKLVVLVTQKGRRTAVKTAMVRITR
jgi:hypothetical protein